MYTAGILAPLPVSLEITFNIRQRGRTLAILLSSPQSDIDFVIKIKSWYSML